MDERYTLTVEREIPGPIAAVFDAWLDAATMAQWMSPAPDIFQSKPQATRLLAAGSEW